MSPRRLQIAKILFLLAASWLVWELWPGAFAAFGLSLVVSGWFVLLNGLSGLSFGKEYYRIRAWEASLYEILGVQWFKALVNTGWYRALWGPSLRRRGEKHGLERLAEEMRAAETAHACALVLITVLTIYAGQVRVIAGLIIGNAVMNFYPVILQRRNRMRVENILRRRGARPPREAREGEVWSAT